MDRASAGAYAANELDFLGRHHFNRTRRRGHNAMTGRRMHNELGLIQEDPATFLEPSPEELRAARERTASNLRLFWEQRRFLLRWTLIGLVISLVVALLIPSRYVATTQLMPPDNQSAGGGGAALLSAASRSAGSLVGIAGDLLGAKNSGALF